MSRRKAVFNTLFPGVLLLIAAYSVVRLALSGEILVWAGPLLTTLPFLVFLTVTLSLARRARTRPTLPGISALAVLGIGLSVAALLLRPGSGAPAAVALAASGAGVLAIYLLWSSRFGRRPSEPLTLGAKLPALPLARAGGAPFTVRELAGRPALIFFYRGNWCPFCVAQIKEVVSLYREIASLGVRVVLVSPQPDDQTVALAKRFQVPIDFLVDRGNAAARALGIEDRGGVPLGLGRLGYDPDTVLPTVIVLDRDSRVHWVDQTDNYRVRPEPETFLPVLRDLAAKRSF